MFARIANEHNPIATNANISRSRFLPRSINQFAVNNKDIELLSWCGFLFDTTIVGFLSYGRTRPYAYGVLLFFHSFTRALFLIGMFPVIMS